MSSPQIISTIHKMQSAVCAADMRVAVYTMGALHQGHVQLMTAAREYAQARGKSCELVVTIFVNPTQFENETDLAKYPRTLESDVEICRDAGVDIVFAPTVEQMYPNGTELDTSLIAWEIGDELEGISRPGHFDAMLTVVNKLTNIVSPDAMFFGEKDFQQLTLVRAMVRDLNMNVDVVGVPTVREKDGLALSSRNVRLDEHAREVATHIPATLVLVRSSLDEGHTIKDARQAGLDYLARYPEIDVDYLEIRSASLDAPAEGPGRILIAATVSGVRLLDNTEVQIGGESCS